MTRVLIVSSKELFRVGISCLLAKYSRYSLKLCDVVFQEALSACKRFEPSVVFLDTDAPDGRGSDLVTKIIHCSCKPKVVLFTYEREAALLNLQLETGATSFLTKNCSVDDCIDALNAAIDGTYYASPEFSRLITLGKLDGADKKALINLSRREMSTMLMLAQGKTHQEIAKSLKISPKTVTTYKARIHEKLKTRNTADITRVAVRAGLLKPT